MCHFLCTTYERDSDQKSLLLTMRRELMNNSAAPIPHRPGFPLLPFPPLTLACQAHQGAGGCLTDGLGPGSLPAKTAHQMLHWT